MIRYLLTFIMLSVPAAGFCRADSTAWAGKTEIAYVKTGGNTSTETFSGRFTCSAARLENRFIVKAGYIHAVSNDVRQANRFDSDARYERLISKRLFLFLAASYLKDTFSGFNSRVTAGTGLGIDALNRAGHTLKCRAEILMLFDDYTSSEVSDRKQGSTRLNAGYTWKTSEKAALHIMGSGLFPFSEGTEWILDAEAGLEASMTSRLSIGLTYIVQYQNNPPVPGIQKRDTTVLTSLNISL